MASPSAGAEGIDLEVFSTSYQQEFQNRLQFKTNPIDVINVKTCTGSEPTISFDTIGTTRQLTDWLTEGDFEDGERLAVSAASEQIICRLRLILPHISGREEADPLDFPDDFYAIPEHRMVPFCREHFNLIINGMGLPTATSETIYSRHDHFRHYQMGISSLEESNLGVLLRLSTKGILSMNTTLSLSYNAGTRTTNALILGLAPSQGQFIRDRIKALSPVATHPAFLPTLLLSLRQSLLAKLINLELEKLYSVEAASGDTWLAYRYLKMDSLGKKGPRDEVNTNAALGIVQLVTAWEHYGKTLTRQLSLLRKLVDKVGEASEGECETLTVASDIIREKADFLEEDCHTMVHESQYIKDRAIAEISAIYNSIAQRGNEVSRDIAMMSQADGSAMKSIAVLTMTFLPATFLATYFSTPNSMPDGSHGWFYWVIAIPLTLCTLGLWAWWDWHSARKRHQQRKAPTSISSTRASRAAAHARRSNFTMRPQPAASRTADLWSLPPSDEDEIAPQAESRPISFRPGLPKPRDLEMASALPRTR